MLPKIQNLLEIIALTAILMHAVYRKKEVVSVPFVFIGLLIASCVATIIYYFTVNAEFVSLSLIEMFSGLV